MRLLRSLRSSLLWLFKRSVTEQDLDDELRDYLEHETRRLMAGGLSYDAARPAALCEIGGLEQVKEHCRDARRLQQVDNLLQDSRYAVRLLRRSPAFTVATILTLAVGIGANTAIFSLMDAVLWQTLPVANPKQLVLFGAADGNFGGNFAQVGAWGAYSFPLYQQFKEENSYFDDLCAFQSYTSRLNVRVGGTPARVALGKVVTGSYFSVLGLNAYRGRLLNPSDDNERRDVAVISYDVWMRLFSGDSGWIGRSIDINGRSIEIVGVTPPDFFGETVEPEPPDFWLPLHLQPILMLQGSYFENAEMHWLNVMGRLKPAADVRAAQVQMTHVLQQFLWAYAGPAVSPEKKHLISTCHVEFTPGSRGISKLRQQFSAPLHVLMAIVALVLLIACANIANLLLARTVGRQKEISMRLVLGANRVRLVRQLLTESVILALIGGGVGFLLASVASRLLVQILSQNGHAYPLSTAPNVRVLVFTGAVALLTAIVFGLAPALRSTRIDLAPSLVGSDTRARSGGAELLILTQLAISVLLLSAAGLLIRSFMNLERQNLGFNPSHVLSVLFDPRLAGYKPGRLTLLNQEIERRVTAIPGVVAAGLAKTSLLGTDNISGDISVAGYTPRPGEDMNIEVNMVSPLYFQAEGMRLLRGRFFAWKDAGRRSAAAVINETMARRFFPQRDAIGETFAFGSPEQIVGIVEDARYDSLKGKTPPMAYVLLTHYSANDLEVRTAVDPMSVADAVRRTLRQIDPNIPILRVTTLGRRVDESAAQEQLVANVAGFFALLSLVLASIGLYGILSSAVSRQRKEIGIRMAIGAKPAEVVMMMTRRSAAVVGGGLVIGFALANWTNRLIASQLFGVHANDPWTMCIALAALFLVSFFSVLAPVSRAAKVDPAAILRYE